MESDAVQWFSSESFGKINYNSPFGNQVMAVLTATSYITLSVFDGIELGVLRAPPLKLVGSYFNL